MNEHPDLRQRGNEGGDHLSCGARLAGFEVSTEALFQIRGKTTSLTPACPVRRSAFLTAK
jgi:hypothetical protein